MPTTRRRAKPMTIANLFSWVITTRPCEGGILSTTDHFLLHPCREKGSLIPAG
jgi:hypothetical protein